MAEIYRQESLFQLLSNIYMVYKSLFFLSMVITNGLSSLFWHRLYVLTISVCVNLHNLS